MSESIITISIGWTKKRKINILFVIFFNESFNFFNNTKAVLLEFYHSATASVCKENNVVPFIKKCCKNNLDVYFCSMKKNGGVYMSCAEILASGAKPIYDSSVYSAYAHLLLKYNAI